MNTSAITQAERGQHWASQEPVAGATDFASTPEELAPFVGRNDAEAIATLTAQLLIVDERARAQGQSLVAILRVAARDAFGINV